MSGDPTSTPMESGDKFFHRVFHSGVWAFSLRIIHQVFYFARIIILVRILTPHDFGLMGIALLTISLLNLFSQTGFHSAIIQKKEKVEEYLDAAWTIQLARGLVLFLILYFISPLLSSFFKTPEAEIIIQVIGISLLFQALTNIGVIYFQKELEFNKQFLYQSVSLLIDFIVATSAAILLKSVWALVFGRLAGDVARCILSYVIHPFRPRIRFDIKRSTELFGFGKWVLGSSVLIFFITQGDDIFVGKILGATMLGLYQLAYKISNTPATEITNVISEVMFPAYSKIQDDLAKIRTVFLKVLKMTTFFSLPIAGMIFVLLPDFTKIFFGDKWMGMVGAAQVLCFFGLLISMSTTFGAVFYAKGKPQILTRIGIIQLLFLAFVIYPLTHFGRIVGTSIAVTLTCSIDLIICYIEMNKLLACGWREILAQIRPQALVTLGMVGVIYLLKSLTAGKVSLLLTFVLSIILAMVIYGMYGRRIFFSFLKLMGQFSLRSPQA